MAWYALDRSSKQTSMDTLIYRELKVLKTMRGHPNIVRFVAHGMDGSFHYIVMDKVEGHNLEEIMTTIERQVISFLN